MAAIGTSGKSVTFQTKKIIIRAEYRVYGTNTKTRFRNTIGY